MNKEKWIKQKIESLKGIPKYKNSKTLHLLAEQLWEEENKNVFNYKEEKLEVLENIEELDEEFEDAETKKERKKR